MAKKPGKRQVQLLEACERAPVAYHYIEQWKMSKRWGTTVTRRGPYLPDGLSFAAARSCGERGWVETGGGQIRITDAGRAVLEVARG